MDDARRFLRYIIPGALFAIETTTLLLVLFPDATLAYLTGLQKGGGTGWALVAVLGSGALGYFFSTVHHWLYWTFPEVHRAPDYTEMLRRWRREGRLIVTDTRTGHVIENPEWPTNRLRAWALVNGVWHKESQKIGKATDERADSLAHLVHSVGAALVATIVACVTTLIIAKHVSPRFVATPSEWRIGLASALAAGLFAMHYMSYNHLMEICDRFVLQSFNDAVQPTEQDPLRTFSIL